MKHSIKLTELLSSTITDVRGDISDVIISDMVYDSRKVSEGCLFFCLTGASRDGHSYARAAYDAGCRAFTVERFLELPDDAVQLLTESSRSALAIMSAEFYGRPAEKMTMIGITGTKGKTTTSILIREILCSHGIPCGYIGSNGVMYGEHRYHTVNTTPESRELHRIFRDMLDDGITHVVMEVSSQALANYRVDGISFDIAVYTNLSQDHISPTEHSTFEEYRDAKRRLYTEHNAKTVIYNSDDENAGYMMDGVSAKLISYSLNRMSDFRASDITPYRDSTSLGIDFTVTTDGRETGIRLRTPGRFSVYNGLAAIAVCSVCGVSPLSCADSLRKISIQGRFEIVDALPDITFIVDYAHNGLSLTSALRELREYSPRRLICIFGSIGGRAFTRRRELAEAASALADYSIITSDNPDFDDPDEIIADIAQYFEKGSLYTTITDRAEAVRYAVRIAEKGDIILFAGKGHEDYQLIRGQNLPFNERALILSEASRLPVAAL